MEFLLRLAQIHESFRIPELEALANLADVELKILQYSPYSPYCTIELPSTDAARYLVKRSVLTKNIWELWGSGPDYPSLHSSIKARMLRKWPLYSKASFKFSVDAYQGSRSAAEQATLIRSFSYLGFEGPIRMKNAEQEFCIFEDYEFESHDGHGFSAPRMLYFGRFVGEGGRDALNTYTLKKRKYIATTSMDSELALLMANLVLAAPGKLFYDPFVGTGSLPIACSHFGAVSLGSDIDGRAVRGKKGRNVVTNFEQYGILGKYLDGFVGDLTHTPLRLGGSGWLDGIVCDPPYGVREGLKVLGSRDGSGKEILWIDGELAHLQLQHIPPKRPYSLEAILEDILQFAVDALVEDGRISLWMPTANDEEVELEIPMHASLALVSNCVQPFNKWSRRMLTYRKLAVMEAKLSRENRTKISAPSGNANDLNGFRKRYFEGFRPVEESKPNGQQAAMTESKPK